MHAGSPAALRTQAGKQVDHKISPQ